MLHRYIPNITGGFMRALAVLKGITLLALFFGLTRGGAAAQTYEADLKALATNLVAKLEEANQRSGTVLDFNDLQGSPTELGRFLAQELSDDLVAASKKVSFVDRANLQTLLRENKLSAEGLVNPESSRKLGNLIGIDTVIFGTTTPVGDKIRLSVRAVAVETGKIVASQSATLPAGGGLGELYTRGVSGSPSAGIPSASPNSQTADPRTRFRGDSLKVTSKEVIVYQDNRHCNSGDVCASTTLILENLSGIGFDAALINGSASLGGCTPLSVLSGLALADSNGKSQGKDVLRYQPVNSKTKFMTTFHDCRKELFHDVKTIDFSASLVLAVGKEVFSIPISASAIPVRNEVERSDEPSRGTRR